MICYSHSLYRKIDTKDGETPAHRAVETNTYINDTNKTTKHNHYLSIKRRLKMTNVR